MDLETIMKSVYKNLGTSQEYEIYSSRANRTFDINEAGAQRLLVLINRAYKRIIHWKFPDGTQMRFPQTFAHHNFQTTLLTGTAGGGAAGTITLDSSANAGNDYYNDWIVETTGGTGSGQSRVIVDYNTSRVATVNRDWSTTPDTTTTYKVYKQFMKFVNSSATDVDDNIALDPVNSFYTIIKLIDMEDKRNLAPGDRTETYSRNIENSGKPTEYIVYDDRIIFNIAPDDTRWYRMEYIKNLADLSAATDEPQIPEVFHDAIVLYATWIGMKELQDNDAAYSYRRDLDHFMATTKRPDEAELERENGEFTVGFEKD